ncbi:MAG: MBG domain-containing protein [Gracilibacteraceae bacterium]|jgi:hypothetical protein|nr:MBG domain-containing protein [Gracilibacteraceae bacterium]
MHREKSIALLMVAALLLAPFPLPTTAAAVPEPAAAAALPTVGVHVANQVDVALAVGPTDVDYSNFETDLRQALAAKTPAIPAQDIFIMAARGVNTDTTSAFQWWVYDHTAKEGKEEIDEAKHHYIENDVGGENSKHPYLFYSRHMVESDNGASMDFYGYPRGGYTDFRFLPNEQQTKKTFEFAIHEDVAYDALDGVGFLFNLDIRGTYGADQVMTGYLLFLEYSNSGKGQRMVLYKLDGVDTKSLHHGKMTLVNEAPNIRHIAASTAYSSGDKYRRVKIEARPGAVKVWYKGSPTDHNVLTTAIAENAPPVSWTTAPAAPAEEQIILDRSFTTSFGFGPLISYRSHSCDRPTHLRLQHLSMDMETMRRLPEVVREPAWHQNTQKYLVNLNDDKIEDFSSGSVSGELLARLITDDIYYLGWCSQANAADSEKFLQKHNRKGAIINTDDPATDSYQSQIGKIAAKIYERYWRDTAAPVFLVTDNVVLEVSGAPRYNTADADWPEGKWKIVHHPTQELGWDDGTEGEHVLSGQYMSDLDFRFYLPGVYDIYYREALINSLTVHRAPTPRIGVDLSNPAQPVFSDAESFDPDDRRAGIVKKEYSWIDMDDAAMSEPAPGLPGALPNGHTCLVTLTVTDKHGAGAAVTRQLSSGSGTNPPFAYFTLEPALIIQGTPAQTLTLVNGSYDLYGAPLTAYDFTVSKDGAPYGGLQLTGAGEGRYDVSALPPGDYRVALTVKSPRGESLPFVRAFEIRQDRNAPTAKIEPVAPLKFTAESAVTLRFSDTGGSGLREQSVALTTSPTTTPADKWSLFSPSLSRAVALTQDGTYYIHWQATDAAGNKAAGSFGPYILDKNVSDLVLSAQPAGSQFYGKEFVLTAELAAGAYEPKSYVSFFADGDSIGSAPIIGNKATLVCQPDGAKNVLYEARFQESRTHKASSATLPYAIKPSEEARVEIGGQISREYNGRPYEAAQISVSGARSHKIEYRGPGYPLSPQPPVAAGRYEVIVTTTDKDYQVKTHQAPFEILPRWLVLKLETNPPSGTPSGGEVVRLTAVIRNAPDLPPGTVTFTCSGAPLAEVAVTAAAGGGYTAVYDWESRAGAHDIRAEYEPAARDNYIGGVDILARYEVQKNNQQNFGFRQSTIRKTYGDPDFKLEAASGGESSGQVGYYLVTDDTVISFYRITDDVSILRAGRAVIRAVQDGDENYNSASADLLVIVEKKENALAVSVPETKFGQPVGATVAVNESGGLLTYTWRGRGGTVYGPSPTPPRAVGEYTLEVAAAETVNYKGGQTRADFRIIPCDCALGAVSLDAAALTIDYFRLQAEHPLAAEWEFSPCSVHGRIFDLRYEFAGEHPGAGIEGIYPAPVALVANARSAGRTLNVRVTVTHTPTGLSGSREAPLSVVQGTRADSGVLPYRKTTDGDLPVEADSILSQAPFSQVVYAPLIPGLAPRALAEGRDYRAENGRLILSKEFMDTIPPGEREIRVTAGGGEYALRVEVARGLVTVEKTVQPGVIAVTTPLSGEQVAGVVLERQEKTILGNGYDIKIELLVSGLRRPGDAEAAAAGAGTRTVGALFDLTLRKTVGNNPPVLLGALPDGASLTLQAELPPDLRGFPRYWLGRVDQAANGGQRLTLLGARLQDGMSLQFETNHFSTYAILYATSVINLESESEAGGGSGGGAGVGSGSSGSASGSGGGASGPGTAPDAEGPTYPNPPAPPVPGAVPEPLPAVPAPPPAIPEPRPPAVLPAPTPPAPVKPALPPGDREGGQEAPVPFNPKTGAPPSPAPTGKVIASLGALGLAIALYLGRRRERPGKDGAD